MLLHLLCGTAFIMTTLLYGIGAGTVGSKCDAFSTAGTVVQSGSSFVVYCVFDNKPKCAKTMYLDEKRVPLKNFNSTTSTFEIKNISSNRIFACKCDCCVEPCGLDLIVGHPPDVPKNLTCTQQGVNGTITCTWNSGRDPYIETLSRIMVKSSTHNNTITLEPTRFDKGSGSAILPYFGSHCQYSVWVTASNKLGNASSYKFKFTPRDIVKLAAPEITDVQCSSSFCVLHWKAQQTLQLLQVKHRAVSGDWVLHQVNGSISGSPNISNLEPFTWYEFQTRYKLKEKDSDFWSEWSNTSTRRTDEDVPIKELDVWYTKERSHSQEEVYKIFWKELSVSEARGVILGYKVKIKDQLTRKSTEITTTGLFYGPISCFRCNVTVSAYNSKGSSPVTHITLPITTAGFSPQNVTCQPFGLQGLAIFWQKPATAEPVLGYLVEWFTDDLEKRYFGWRRTSSENVEMNITDIQAAGCYTGFVYALYKQGLKGTQFLDSCSLPSAPARVPHIRVHTWSNTSVTVSWVELTQEQSSSCPVKYKIYLESSGTPPFKKQYGPVNSSAEEYTMHTLPLGNYSLRMTVWTSTEPLPVTTEHFTIQAQQNEENQDALVIALLIFTIFTIIMCLSQIPAVCERLLAYSLMILSSVPDPANSKWAKECAAAKGQLLPKYRLNLYSSYNEEHSTIVIEEDSQISEACGNPGNILAEDRPVHHTNKNHTNESHAKPDEKTQPHLSSHTPDHPRPSTHPTVDYISSNDVQDVDSEEEDEEDCLADFFPCPQSPFLESVFLCGRQLTLEHIKINCKSLAE